jgi:putative glutamine amidotransferase
VVGITCDTTAAEPTRGFVAGSPEHRMASPYALCDAITAVGGTPVLLPHEAGRIDDYLAACGAIVLSGGDDPDTTPFGEPTHPMAQLVTPRRQAFELAMLAALDATAHPVLGICLGMQYMALHHGGSLCQHLPDVLDADAAALHAHGTHAVTALDGAPFDSHDVFSHHHQAVSDPGRMRTVATAGDVIEAVAQTGERFYLGVQWHPERADEGQALFTRLIGAAC